MNKKLIRLTESDLHRIVKESVKKVIKEENEPSKDYTQYYELFEGLYKTVFSAYQKLKATFDFRELEAMQYSGKELPTIIAGAVESMRESSSRLKNVIQEIEEPSDSYNEPEDWFERNEHGDFGLVDKHACQGCKYI